MSVSLFKKKILSRDTWNEFLDTHRRFAMPFLASEDRGGGRFRKFYFKTCQHVAMRCELPEECKIFNIMKGKLGLEDNQVGFLRLSVLGRLLCVNGM